MKHPTSIPWHGYETSNFNTLARLWNIQLQYPGTVMKHPTSIPWHGFKTSNFNTLARLWNIQLQYPGMVMKHPTSIPWHGYETSNFNTLAWFWSIVTMRVWVTSNFNTLARFWSITDCYDFTCLGRRQAKAAQTVSPSLQHPMTLLTAVLVELWCKLYDLCWRVVGLGRGVNTQFRIM